MATYYSTPSQYVGKTLDQIRNETNLPFRSDVLGGLLGIDSKTPLNAGQTFTYSGNDPGSAEQQAIGKIFGNGMSEADYQANQVAKQQDAQLAKYNEAIAPAVQTLESSKDPLKARYDKVISDIRSSKDQALKSAGVASAREYGARGLSTDSTGYSDFLANKTAPINTQYSTLETSAAGEEADRLAAINSALAQLKSSGALQGLSAGQAIALAIQAAQESTREFNAQNTLAQQTLDFQKSQTTNPTDKNQYITIPQGNTLFDLLNLQPLYTNPKTYAPSSGGGSSDPFGIL